MSLLQLLQNAQGGQGIDTLAKQFGLEGGQAGQLAEMFAPAIGTAAKKKASQGGLEDLLGTLVGEAQGGMFDDPAQAAAPAGQMQGMDFLKTLMGGDAAPQAMAEEAAGRTGIDPSIIMQFLPALAAMMQGGMQKTVPDTEIASMEGNNVSSLIGGLLNGRGGKPDLGSLGALLDDDGDGSPLNDLIGRFLR
ncbi:DUF937 domain-containing protein [Actibacterium pelagium]|uniref:DUF937 domain-containing protein n=1 Tax=Actibacterium pelagium TaxID=2029103 RepID=A0A917EI55_9RHOB|nr:DUF937 domain-containing protein [Actibacterium pelagium]GGE37709.1 hypothetical protein GCM10011517_01850 [Actibacterium pelagium]